MKTSANRPSISPETSFNKSRRASAAVSIGKKNYINEDDDDNDDDIEFIDGEPMSGTVDLWQSTAVDTFGRSKSVTEKEFDLHDRRSSTQSNHVHNKKRTDSEYELLQRIDSEKFDADIYLAHHGGERNMMRLDSMNPVEDDDDMPKKAMKSNLFDEASNTTNISMDNSKLKETNSTNQLIGALAKKKSVGAIGSSPYLQPASKARSNSILASLGQIRSSSSSNFLNSSLNLNGNDPSDDLMSTGNSSIVDDREREALKVQLEEMKKQNEILQVKIHETQKESESLLQKERHEKMLFLQNVEIQNKILSQELIELRRQSELQMRKEKEDLMLTVKRMEKEKNMLIIELENTESKYSKEIEKLNSEKMSAQSKLDELIRDKLFLLNQLELINIDISRLRDSGEDITNPEKLSELLSQQNEIEIKLQGIVKDEEVLNNAILSSETSLLSYSSEYEKKLLSEKIELQNKLNVMEKEKNELSNHLLQTEKEAQIKISRLSTKLSSEKQVIEESLLKVEEANKELLQKMSETIEKQKHSTIKQSLQLQQEKLILQKQLDDILKEKELLNEKLVIVVKEEKEREKFELEIVMKERNELKALVERMKEDMDAEKSQMNQISQKADAEIMKSTELRRKNSRYQMATDSSKNEDENVDINTNINSANPNASNNGLVKGSRQGKARASITFDETKNKTKEFERMPSENGFDDHSNSTSPTASNSDSSGSDVEYLASHGREDSGSNIICAETELNTYKNVNMLRALSQRSLADMMEDSDVNEEASNYSRFGPKIPPSPAGPPPSISSNNSSSADVLSGVSPHRNSRGIDLSSGLTFAAIYEEETEEEKNDASNLEKLHTMVEGEMNQSHDDMFADLPAPHAAAARGDIQKLQQLYSMDPGLLASLDMKRRSPLFYGVAYSHADVCQYLLSIHPFLAILNDEHGDTALHAAASIGSTECMEILLNVGTISISDYEEASIDPNCRNHKGMTPAHMTASAGILELLLSAGADLTIVDENERSPLFVACAMDRVRSADYLIGCLDLQSDEALLKRDKRGDTPLHAAACNGCVDCLLLLLQYAIDPRLTNDKGLKAIDLAVKNKHNKCKELLAEYHLHFVASSNFDSVLFFSALEGHKFAKSTLSTLGTDATETDSNANSNDNNAAASDDYTILRKSNKDNSAPSSSTKRPDMAGLQKAKSFFSLKTDTALRLETWGKWIAFQDSVNGKTFWYNQESQEGSETEPAEVSRLKALPSNSPNAPNNPSMNSSNNSIGGMTSHLLTRKKSMRLKKTGDWIQYVTPETNQTFFYNDKTREFQWTDPNSIAAVSRCTSRQQLRAAASAVALLNKTSSSMSVANQKSGKLSSKKGGGIAEGEGDTSFSQSDPNLTTATASDGSDGTNTAAAEAAAASDWALYEDPSTGQAFWYNAVTQVSQWECPFDADSEAAAAAAAALTASGKSQQSKSNKSGSGVGEDSLGDNEVDGAVEAAITVHNDEDLGLNSSRQ